MASAKRDTEQLAGFDDLVFGPHPNWPGVQATHWFENGYGVSVVRAQYSYGSSAGLYELAVLKGGPEAWELTYETPITDGVLGYLTPEKVTSLMGDVAALAKARGEG